MIQYYLLFYIYLTNNIESFIFESSSQIIDEMKNTLKEELKDFYKTLNKLNMFMYLLKN